MWRAGANARPSGRSRWRWPTSRLLRGLVIVLVVVAGCGDGTDDGATDEAGPEATSTTEDDMGTTDATPARFEITSPAFGDGATIPERYSCKGDDVSPELRWNDPPAGTVSFALVMDDPDAVPVAGKVWDHWVLWGLPGDARSLPAAVPDDEALAEGATQGRNSFGRIGYGGPCPPGGQTHEYVFVLYALDGEVEPGGRAKIDLLTAMDGHILAEATLRGTFGS
jgi:Raf kinase inhibitor-like YbhB/YbcL family protein